MSQFAPVIPDEPSFRYLQQMAERDRQAPRGRVEKLARHQAAALPSTLVQVYKSGSTAGDVLQASSGVLPGRIRTYKNAAWSSGFPVWIRFIDWEDADSGATYSVHGRYFLGIRGGHYRSASELRTVYFCQAGEQSFLAQTSSAPGKGNSGTYKLYHASESDSGFTQSAKAKGADTPANKWCNVWRNHAGVWYAGPWECS